MRFFYLLLGILSASKLASAIDSDSHECENFFDHASTIAKAAGILDPRKVTGYSPLVCKRTLALMKEKAPVMVDDIKHLARHLKAKASEGSKFTAEDVVLRDLQVEDYPSTCDFAFGQSNPGPNSTALAIEFCQDIENSTPPHNPCVPEYLQTDNDDSKTYGELVPKYPSGTNYDLYTANLDKATWNGCRRDRTDPGRLGNVIKSMIIAASAIIVGDQVCAAFGDDIELVIIFTPIAIDLPNPAKIICSVIMGLVKLIKLGLDILYDQAIYQIDAVNGAEVEAAYDHTKNLLTKQCAIFDQAVCRGTELGYGHGCDGIDSNCNDSVDECDEDIIPPEISVHDTIGLCGSKSLWFSTVAEAENCVEATVGVQDDCQTVTSSVIGDTENCDSTEIHIFAEDACGRSSSSSITVKVDGTPPSVSCGFGQEDRANVEVRPQVFSPALKDVELNYEATDSCGLPLDVTIDIYANEIEISGSQKMALLYQTEGDIAGKAGLFVAHNICSDSGQCIKDSNAPDARRYTAVASATDAAGNSASTECTYTILPKGNLSAKDFDLSDSVQKFLLASHTSVFDQYLPELF